MRKLWLMIPLLAVSLSVTAEEGQEQEDIQFVDEGCASDDFCAPEEEEQEEPEVSCCRRYRLRTGCCYYYGFEERNNEATWPGKNENSFMEEMMR